MANCLKILLVVLAVLSVSAVSGVLRGTEDTGAKATDGNAPLVVDEDKAAQQLELEKRVEELNRSFAAASLRIIELSPTNVLGKLRELERKAFAYDGLRVKMDLKDETIALLKNTIRANQAVIANEKKEISRLAAQTNELANLVVTLQKELVPLNLIRAGQNPEYYEIKEGDTCESIAANPTVYGNAAKHILIRQANRGNVEDLNNLVPGEVLIIPRFATIDKQYDEY